tara:strand:+ start:3120 stop:3920 length:801 start_codon:yes stop_codon:yes gene_type:complete
LKLYNFFKTKKKYNIGVALGGGAARGIAHLGVLLGLEELKVPIGILSGVSSGCLVGGLYAAGVPISVLISKLSSLHWRSFTSFHFSKRGMVSSVRIQRFVESLVGKIAMKDCPIPFIGGVTNILKGEPHAFFNSNHLLSTIIRASVSFPGIYPPVKIDDEFYVDGGVFQNVPIPILRTYGAQKIIGVDVIPSGVLEELPRNVPLMVDRSLDLMLNSQRKMMDQPDVLLTPVITDVSSFDLKSYDRLVEYGYQSVMKSKKSLLSLVS